MTTDAQKAINVSRTLARVGMAMTLSRASSSPATYDPATGAATAVLPKTYSVIGTHPYPYSLRETDGTQVLLSDMRVLLGATSGVVPQPGDTLLVGTKTYRVMNVGTIGPAGIDILYDLQVRA